MAIYPREPGSALLTLRVDWLAWCSVWTDAPPDAKQPTSPDRPHPFFIHKLTLKGKGICILHVSSWICSSKLQHLLFTGRL